MTTEEKILELCKLNHLYRIPPKDAPYSDRWWCRQYRLWARKQARAVLARIDSSLTLEKK